MGIVHSDEEGRYEIVIPKGRAPSIQLRDHRVYQTLADQSRYQASYAPFISETALADNRTIFSKVNGRRDHQLQYNKLTEDVSNLDWVYSRDDLGRKPSQRLTQMIYRVTKENHVVDEAGYEAPH